MNTYNTKLQNNNTNLSSILDKVNALPEAGGGSSLETCEVTVIHQWGGNDDPYHGQVELYYVVVSGDGALSNEMVLLTSYNDLLPEHRITFTTLKKVPVVVGVNSYWGGRGESAMTGGSLKWYEAGYEHDADTADTISDYLIGIAIPTEDAATLTFATA